MMIKVTYYAEKMPGPMIGGGKQGQYASGETLEQVLNQMEEHGHSIVSVSWMGERGSDFTKVLIVSRVE